MSEMTLFQIGVLIGFSLVAIGIVIALCVEWARVRTIDRIAREVAQEDADAIARLMADDARRKKALNNLREFNRQQRGA